MGAQQTAFDFAPVVHDGAERECATPPADASVEQRLQRLLGSLLGTPIALTWTDNGRSMISARQRDGQTRLRLHHMFTEADDATLRALAQFLLGGRGGACEALHDFIAERRQRIDHSRRRSAPARRRRSASR